MNLFPPEINEIVLSNYPLILASLVGYFAIFVLISYWAKRRLSEDVGDYVVASRSLGWLVVTFTMYASVLSGVGMREEDEEGTDISRCRSGWLLS